MSVRLYDPVAATRHLKKADSVLAALIAQVGPCTLVPKADVSPFHALARSIVFQQLNGRAATTIHERVLAVFGGQPQLTPEALLTCAPETLRACGLSASKLAALRDLAARTLDGTVPDLATAQQLSDDELAARLIEVRGIGLWTVQMMLIFYLGRPDVLPVGDYAIQRAFRLLYKKRRPPSPAIMLKQARAWQPYRSVASWYLWRSLDTTT